MWIIVFVKTLKRLKERFLVITGNNIRIYYALDSKEYVNDHFPYVVSGVGEYKDILYYSNSTVCSN